MDKILLNHTEYEKCTQKKKIEILRDLQDELTRYLYSDSDKNLSEIIIVNEAKPKGYTRRAKTALKSILEAIEALDTNRESKLIVASKTELEQEKTVELTKTQKRARFLRNGSI